MLKNCFLLFLSFLLTACAGVTRPIPFQATEVVTKESYRQNKHKNGVVLMDVNWGRRWDCGGRENAQLISLAFDKIPVNDVNNEADPALVLQNPSRLAAEPRFMNYAFSLEPGEYALSAFSIKVANSISDVGFLTARRDRLFDEGKPVGGTFIAKPGEAVFIGNFYLDCTHGPTLWRYYPDGWESFEAQVNEYRESFPFLALDDVRFRLFKTKKFGRDYDLAP